MTPLGKTFAGICALSAIILLGLPIGLLSSKFNDTYTTEKTKNKIIKRYRAKERLENEKLNKKILIF